MYMWAGGIDLCYLTYKYYSLLEEFEDIKGVIRSRKSKNDITYNV